MNQHPPADSPSSADPVESQAADWLAKLRRPDRSAATEEAFRRWLASDSSHEQAFSRATQIWEDLGGVGRAHRTRQVGRRRVLVAAAAVGVVILGGLTFTRLNLDPGVPYSTVVGQQRVISLSDGSRVTMNTDTKVVVRYSRRERSLRLERGEALFDVAKDAQRPFVVSAAGRDVRAIGTSFTVSRAAALQVILLEGRVRIRDPESAPNGAEVALAPGQRWRVDTGRVETLSPEEVEATVGWLNNELIFYDVTLAAALEQVNRYAPTKLQLSDPRAADLRVSGIFRAGDTDYFAKAIGSLYGVTLVAGPTAKLEGRTQARR